MSIIFNGVGVLIADSEILLANLIKKENKFLLGDFLSSQLDINFSNSTSEIILLSRLEEFFDANTFEYSRTRLTLPHNEYYVFSFPYEKNLSGTDLRKQIDWELSIYFPDIPPEKFIVSHYFSEIDGRRFVNVIALQKKLFEVILKFASRKKIQIDFIDHPAIAAFNASKKLKKISEGVFAYFADNFATFAESENGKLVRMKSFKIKDESFVDSVKKFIEKTEWRNETIIATGGDLSAELIETFENAGFQIDKPNFSSMIDESVSLTENDLNAIAPIIGLLFRVK
jgi:predicted CopG family antitoxin